MATTVSVLGRTKVKRVIVGKPIRRITAGGNSISALGGVVTTGAVNGSVLIYNGTTGNWEAQLELNQQEVNGGQY
ncbi:hypothetical protein OAS42_00520 [bacterium]|nr:hypothetical protein [bacterium]